MGVGGNFWDLLKPYVRHEGFDYLRDKRVAVDLSFWIVQHETAVKGFVRKPHLRLTFFRTINLFSKFGAYPVFVVDGTPSPLKSQARIARFFRCSGIDVSSLTVAEDGASVERNRAFSECVSECVELLELLGMPIVKAKGEAEALCADLNRKGHVDVCITPDSDAFLFGAKSVIKCVKPNSKEPFECYHMSDMEAGLGLKRKHLIAISLLVGNDYDLCGVQGVGLDTALRFARSFCEDEILDRLCDIGKGLRPEVQGGIKSVDDDESRSDGSSKMKRSSHCSYCGHPGSKRTHFKVSCKDCGSRSGCIKKPSGFRCECSYCCKDREEKEQKKTETWWIKFCNKITQGPEFPNNQIIELYLCDGSREFAGDSCSISWETPNTEMLVDFLVYRLRWEPSYVRKMMLPMLSTIYLRERSRGLGKMLLYDQYEFHSIQRIKIRYGHQSFVVSWRKSVSTPGIAISDSPQEESSVLQDELIEDEEPFDPLDDSSEPQVRDDGDQFLLTDESIGLVQSAFPDEVERFLHEKELQESKRKKVASSSSKSESPRSVGVQRSITDFYRSTKAQTYANQGEGPKHSTQGSPNEKRRKSVSNLSNKGALSLETFENKGKSPDDICVLLLDGDPTCLMIISKMLQKSGYTVLTAGSATDALCIIKDKDGEIDLIMAETHLPDMDKYELLEAIGGISDLPVIIMASDQHETTMLGCLFKDETNRDKKRKGRAETEKNEEYDETYELGDQKKSKLMCTDDLQNRFCQVMGDQYPDGAYPEIIPQDLNIPGPTEEDIFAHIQEQQVIETTARSQTASNFQAGGCLQFPETANLQSQAESSNNAAHIPLQNLYQNVNNSGAEELELNQRETDFSDFLNLGFELLLDWPDLLEEPFPKQEDHQQEQEQLPQQAQASSDIPKKSIEELIHELFNDIL